MVAKKTTAKKTTAKKTTAQQREADPDKWKRDVVRIAMREAKMHGWCSVVNKAIVEAGLGDYLPPEFVLQNKIDAVHGWSDIRITFGDPSVLDQFFEQYVNRRNIRAIDAIKNRVAPNILTKTSAEIAQDVVQMIEQVKTSTDQYPQYRIIQRPQDSGSRRNQSSVVVLKTEDDLKAAKKTTAAKKATAKKATKRTPRKTTATTA